MGVPRSHGSRYQGWWRFPAHFAYPRYQRGWQAEGDVRDDVGQGYRPPLLQHRVQEGRRGHGQARCELTQKEMDDLVNVVQNPNEYKIPAWMLNRRKDFKDGKTSQVSSSQIDAKLRDDLERLKKIRNHRGLRHYWGLRVRGQHTKTTGRRGKTVGVSKKKG